mmetsp:Transcript_9088/g.27578  ORF Transcript_9088/g.27578 Transcript_9088/m.27578 type:complete len:437 (-) Transcript_9088:174-1484(-)
MGRECGSPKRTLQSNLHHFRPLSLSRARSLSFSLGGLAYGEHAGQNGEVWRDALQDAWAPVEGLGESDLLAGWRCPELLEERVGLLRCGQVEGLQHDRRISQKLLRGTAGVVVIVRELWKVRANRFEHRALCEDHSHRLDVTLVHNALVWQRDEPVVHWRVVGDDRRVERGEDGTQEGWVAGRGLQSARVIQEGLDQGVGQHGVDGVEECVGPPAAAVVVADDVRDVRSRLLQKRLKHRRRQLRVDQSAEHSLESSAKHELTNVHPVQQDLNARGPEEGGEGLNPKVAPRGEIGEQEPRGLKELLLGSSQPDVILQERQEVWRYLVHSVHHDPADDGAHVPQHVHHVLWDAQGHARLHEWGPELELEAVGNLDLGTGAHDLRWLHGRLQRGQLEVALCVVHVPPQVHILDQVDDEDPSLVGVPQVERVERLLGGRP